MMKVMIGDDCDDCDDGNDDDDGDVIENHDEILTTMIQMMADDEKHS